MDLVGADKAKRYIGTHRFDLAVGTLFPLCP